MHRCVDVDEFSVNFGARVVASSDWPILFSEAPVITAEFENRSLAVSPEAQPLGGLPSLSHKTGDMYIQCSLL